MTGPVTINLAEALGSDLLARIEKFFAQGITVEYPLHEKETTMTTTLNAYGIEIEISEDGYLLGKGDYGSGPTYAAAGPEGVDALREYFQSERDQELGRWRSKEHPNYVVYPVEGKTREVRVTNEATGVTRSYRDHPDYLEANTKIRALVAREYFAAHSEPKPWQDAKPGEAWVLTIDGTEHLAQTITGRIVIYPHDADPEFFIPTLIPANTIGDIWEHTWSPSDHRITAGRRIWPEESDDE